MRKYGPLGLFGWLACATAALAQGRPLEDGLPAAAGPPVPVIRVATTPAPAPPLAAPLAPEQPAALAPPLRPVGLLRGPADELEERTRELRRLKKEVARLGDAKEAERLRKQMDLLQKQIAVLEKMMELLAGELKKRPPEEKRQSEEALEKLQVQTAALDTRTKQAAQRDQELAYAIDDLREQTDADRRWGPRLPAPLKELFLPSGTNESPLSIYGALAVGYSKIEGNALTAANGHGRPSTPGGFYFGEFTPDFFLKLNDWILLEAEIAVGPDGTVKAGGFAQVDFFVNDYLTIVAGRFVAPIGWYNLRSNNPWVTKLPTDAPGSAPLLWQQVLPLFSLLGVQAQGSFYLGCSPVKVEYNAYISNGLNVTPATAGQPDINELANLENMQSTFTTITNDQAVGGRLGLWWPEVGLAGGISGLANGDYIAGGFENSISLWALDLNYHKGNWDVRAEYGKTWQQTEPFIKGNIRRQGFHGQVAYRPRDCPNKYLQNVEFIYRYSYADFRSIHKKDLDLTTFATPIDVPVQRQQNEIGIDYWFAPRMVLKVAYQINDERGFHLHDNQFITELAWGF
jgi:hypothetical protein